MSSTFVHVAKPLAAYPHIKQAGNLIFISGTSSRQPDNSIAGAELIDGVWKLDIKEQTRGVIKNIEKMLKEVGCGLENLVDLTVFLVNMADYAEFNTVYNEFFSGLQGPTRTTIGVRELPLPPLLIEIKAIAAR